MGGIIHLANLVNREICSVNVRGELGHEWCTEGAKSVERDPVEEFVLLDFIGTTTAEAVRCIANKAIFAS